MAVILKVQRALDCAGNRRQAGNQEQVLQLRAILRNNKTTKCTSQHYKVLDFRKSQKTIKLMLSLIIINSKRARHQHLR